MVRQLGQTEKLSSIAELSAKAVSRQSDVRGFRLV